MWRPCADRHGHQPGHHVEVFRGADRIDDAEVVMRSPDAYSTACLE